MPVNTYATVAIGSTGANTVDTSVVTAPDGNTVAIGNNASGTGYGNVAIGWSVSAQGNQAIAIGAGSDTSRAATAVPSTTLNGTTYYFAGGATTLAGDQVSIGRVGYERQIKNVAAGVAKLDNKIDQTGAMSAALAGLKPMQYDPLEPTQIMVGFGSYHSEQSLAMGVSYFKNESTMIHAGAAMAKGDYMFNAGVTWKVGNRNGEDAVPERYKAGPISSVYVLQDEVTAMKAQNIALLAENKAQKDEIADMKAKIEMLMKHAGL